MDLKVQLLPNNEIRAVLYPVRVSKYETDESKVETARIGSHGDSPEGIRRRPPSVPPLPYLTLHSNSTTLPRPGFGMTPTRTTRFGKGGRRRLLQAGGVLDKILPGPEAAVFLTGTLPGSTELSKAAMSAWSSYIVQSLKNWMSHYRSDPYDFYVWELQRRGALHLHYVTVIRDPIVRAEVIAGFKRAWIRIMRNVSELSGVDMFARSRGGTWAKNPEVTQAYAQECKKSAVAYLSKYATKSNKGFGCICKYQPVRYWGVSRPLLAKIREMTEEFVIPGLRLRRGRQMLQVVAEVLEKHEGKYHQAVHAYLPSEWVIGYAESDRVDAIFGEIKCHLTREVPSFCSSKLLETTIKMISRLLTSMRKHSCFSTPLATSRLSCLEMHRDGLERSVSEGQLSTETVFSLHELTCSVLELLNMVPLSLSSSLNRSSFTLWSQWKKVLNSAIQSGLIQKVPD